MAAALLGAWGGWTVRDWKADGDALKSLKTAITTVERQRGVIDSAAQAYEQERQDGAGQAVERTNEIRTIYRDRPVPADCAPPAAVGSVLDAAVLSANARAAGQPAPGLLTAAGAAENSD